MKTALATLAAAGLALSATTAQAETVHVTYDDLDLGSIAGQKVLSARIDRARAQGLRPTIAPERATCGWTR